MGRGNEKPYKSEREAGGVEHGLDGWRGDKARLSECTRGHINGGRLFLVAAAVVRKANAITHQSPPCAAAVKKPSKTHQRFCTDFQSSLSRAISPTPTPPPPPALLPVLVLLSLDPLDYHHYEASSRDAPQQPNREDDETNGCFEKLNRSSPKCLKPPLHWRMPYAAWGLRSKGENGREEKP